MAFHVAMFTFEGIGIVLPLENKMKTPKGMPGWTGVLNTGMILVACLYIAVGFFGYLKYGDEVIDYCWLNHRQCFSSAKKLCKVAYYIAFVTCNVI